MKVSEIMKSLLAIILALITSGIAFSQSDKILKNILTEKNIPKEKIVKDKICFKSIPNDTKTLIYVIPVKTEDQIDYWSADIHLFKINLSTNRILAYSILRDAIQSDAISLNNIWIDTAPYFIHNNIRAFGIRLNYANNSRAAGFDKEDLLLIEPKNNNLVQILKITTSENLSYGGGDCENTEIQNQNSILIMDKQNTKNGYFNIIEKLHYEHYFLNKQCEAKEKEIKDIKNMYHFVDSTYLPIGERLEGYDKP